MKVERKPYLKTHDNGKPYFSWKKRGSNMPTHMFKMLVGHVGQHFIAHQKDIDYVPSSIENAYLAKTFCRWLGDVYANVDEMHWLAVNQQIKWLFTKQDLLAVHPKQKHMVQLHFIGRNLLEELLK